MIGVGVAKCAVGGCPQAHVPGPGRGRCGRQRGGARRPARLRVGRGGADRRRVDLERRRRVQAAAGAERRADARGDGRDGDLALRRRLVARGAHARTAEQHGSVVSQIARATFPAGSPGAIFYYLVQGLTFAILVLAANTSYQGFPRLAAILARDRFFPRQFVNLGDRLVYSNGIIVLAGVASLLIWAFKAERQRADPPVRDRRLHGVHALAGRDGPLLAPRARTPGWQRRAAINGAGAVATRDRRAARRRDEVPRRAPGQSPSRSRCSSRALLRASTATTEGRPPPPRRDRARSRRRRRRRTRSSSTSESYDAALREAVWYAPADPGDEFRADARAAGRRSDSGIRPRFRQLTDIRPDLEMRADRAKGGPRR